MKRLLYVALMLVMSFGLMPVDAQSCDDLTTGAYFTRGVQRYEAGDFESALGDFDCAIGEGSDNPDYYNYRGIIHNHLGNSADAINDYNAALELDETYAYAYNNRGNVYYDRGLYDRAFDDYELAIEYDSIPNVPYYNRGLLYYEQGDYESAEGDLLSSLDADPSYQYAYIGLGWVYLMLNDDRQHDSFLQWIELNHLESVEETITSSIQNETYEMETGTTYYIHFDGEAEQVISASAKADTGSQVDPLLVLLRGDGTAIMSDDDSGVNTDAVISDFELDAQSVYTIILSTGAGGDTGTISLTIDLGEEDSIVTERFATFNLEVNETAEVFTTAGDRLNLREGPGLDFEIVEKLDAGTLVTLIDGPRKADGYQWWRIRNDAGIEGWAVERVDEEQTLQLALLVGEDAIVTTGGDKLNVRSGAGTGNELAFQIDDGSTVTLLEVPQVANGFRWWKIRTADGQEGWTIDRFEGDRMLIPARETE